MRAAFVMGSTLVAVGLATILNVVAPGGVSPILNVGLPLVGGFVLWGRTRLERGLSIVTCTTALLGFNARDLGLSPSRQHARKRVSTSANAPSPVVIGASTFLSEAAPSRMPPARS